MAIPTSDGRQPAPPIRGEERAGLVNDLALKELSHEQLAVKYERSLDAIRRFSCRNSAEIAGRRAVLDGTANGEATHLWTADKNRVRERLQDVADGQWARLEDPELDDRLRIRLEREHRATLHELNEMGGFLTQRSQVEVSGAGGLEALLSSDVIAVDSDGKWHAVAKS